MQSTSATWKRLWASGAALEARAVIDGTAYTAISAPVIRRAAMQEKLSVGNVAAASLSLALRGAGSVPRSAEVVIEARLNDGETASEWLPQGTFYISRRSRDPVTGLLSLECYDALLKANATWTPSEGDWPRDMAAVTAELAALLGLELDTRSQVPTGMPFVIGQPAAGATIRDVLGYIAQAGGGNWIVTPENRLRLVPLTEADGDAVEVPAALGGVDAGATGTVTGLRCTVDGLTTLTGDDSGIVLDLTLAPLLAAQVAENLLGLNHRHFALRTAVCDPALELGDRVCYGDDLTGVVCDITATLGPAYRADLSAPQPGELADEYPYVGAQQQAVGVLQAQVKEITDAAVASTTVLYAAGDSATLPPADGWSTSPPERGPGEYLWQRTVTTYVNGETQTGMAVNITGADGESAAVLRIDSSRGTVFKDNNVSTVLSVSVHYGARLIEDIAALRAAFGSGAYLQWEWLRMDEDRYGVISADDSRLSDGGFKLALGPEDVDVKVTFRCALVID